MPSSCDNSMMLSQVFNRSTALRRNSFGYLPTRLLTTCSSFPCIVCLHRVSQVKGSVHSRHTGHTPRSQNSEDEGRAELLIISGHEPYGSIVASPAGNDRRK